MIADKIAVTCYLCMSYPFLILIILQMLSGAIYFDRSGEHGWEAINSTSKSLLSKQTTYCGTAQWAHFWLSRPFPGDKPEGPDQTFPYGDDGGGRWRLHTGVDFPGPMHTPVLAPGAGYVVFAGTDAVFRFATEPNYYGNLIIIKLEREYYPCADTGWEWNNCGPEPVFVLYGHLNTISVKVGQRVKAGDLIGTVGMTGIAIGPHLHLEVRLGSITDFSTTRNPVLWIRPSDGRGLIAGTLLDADGHHIRNDRLLIYRADNEMKLWRVIKTYSTQRIINPDDLWDENFAVTDVPPGRYVLVAGHGANVIRVPVIVAARCVSFVEIRLPERHQDSQ